MLAALSALKAVGLILVGQAVAFGIAVVAAGRPAGAHGGSGGGALHLAESLAPALAGGCAGVLVRSLAIWGLAYASQRVALGAKERLRHRLVSAVLAGRAHADGPDAPRGSGAVAALASRGLDGLDEYYTTFLPAMVGAAVVPAFIGARILAADWVSAVVLVCTVPLVPVFMALIGLHTRERISRAAAGLDALSNQLAELAQGLPALVGLRRAAGRQRGLGEVSQRYRERTMGTLRTAFLSGFALELIATISVAVVAVFVGVRLVHGSLGLEVGLLALVLAPEVFLPLRSVGAAFHASEDGVEALRRAEALLGGHGPDGRPEDSAARPGTGTGTGTVHVHGLRVRYPGAGRDALQAGELALQPGGVAVLDGASGTGKTTWLKALAGLLPAGTTVGGSLVVPPPAATAWIGQHPRFTEATAARELAFHAPEATEADIAAALHRVNAATLGERPLELLSPGEQRRIAVARGLLRVRRAGARLVLADEPTAHLDPVSAAAVRAALSGLRGTATLVVATHDTELAAQLRGTAADAVADAVADPSAPDRHAADPRTAEVQPAYARAADGWTPPALAGGTADATFGDGTRRPAAGARWRLLASIRWLRSGLGGGVLLAAAAVLSGAALSAVSGWLIVNASTRPPMMVLMVAIVGVRFFGLGRAALRYVQQLAVHRAVLDWATVLRTRLWEALSERPAGWGKLTRSGDALTHLVADVDELRDAAPRVLVPLPAAVLAWVGSLATAAWLVPSTLWVFALAGVLGFGVGPWLALQVERGSAARAARHRSWIAGRLSVLIAASADLRANGASGRAAGTFARRDHDASRALVRAAAGTGLGEAVAALSAGLAALGCIAVVAVSGAAGADSAALLAVVALLGLSLQEPFANASDAMARLPLFRDRLDAVAEALEPATSASAPLAAIPGCPDAGRGAGAGGSPSSAGAARLGGLELDGVAVSWNGATDVVADVSARVGRGEWLAITGPSGSGKSSLLAVLLGLVQPSAGALRLLPGPGTPLEHGTPLDPWSDPTAAAPLLGRITWCPQEAHLFDSTVRNNLGLGRGNDDPATDAELRAAVTAVGLGSWLADQPEGLDTRIGSGGHRLSGGQRQRLAVARALVARAEVVLLDEPTAHLGQDEAGELVSDLRRALAGAAVVMVTHDPAMAARADAVLDLAVVGHRQAQLA